MQVQVTFRHMEPTKALKSYTSERIGRIEKQLAKESAAEVILSVERHHHMADIKLRSGGVNMRGRESSTDMYNSIDRAIAKIERQLGRYQGKLRRFVQPPTAQQVALHTLEQPDDVDGQVSEQQQPEVVRTTLVDAKPLTTEEAIMQMDLLHREFLVFVDADSQHIKVLYRMDEGKLGLIDTAGDEPIGNA